MMCVVAPGRTTGYIAVRHAISIFISSVPRPHRSRREICKQQLVHGKQSRKLGYGHGHEGDSHRILEMVAEAAANRVEIKMEETAVH